MISLKEVSAGYTAGTAVLRGVSFEVTAGERTALVGANGAGKTSLLLTLVGVLPLAAGEFTLDGITLRAGEGRAGPRESRNSQTRELRRRAALVFQNPDDQLFMPRVYDDLAFGPRNLGLGEEEVRRRVEAALDRLGIAFLRDKSPLKLSGGEKRMAAIASVLTMEPSVLLFDEPTAFLDPKARRVLTRALEALLSDRRSATALIATHDLAFAAELCDRVIFLREGRVFAQGPAAELLGDARLLDAVFM
jgi:cobalt/nickel transport system ATP-binding protein